MDQFSKYGNLAPRIASQNAPKTLSKVRNVFILNISQRQIFN